MACTFADFNSKEYSECALCFDDITADNHVFYKDNNDSPWLSCKFCSTCVQDIANSQWSIYTEQIKNETCVATLKHLIEAGPPINFRDKKAVPCNNSTGEVSEFYYDNTIQSAKLKDSFVGDERLKYIDELKKMYEVLQAATGDYLEK